MIRKFTATALLAGGFLLAAPAAAQAACEPLPGPQRACAGDTYTPTGKGAPFGKIKGSAKVSYTVGGYAL